MKETPIIPMIKFESQKLPFKIQTFKDMAIACDDSNDLPHSHDYYELIWMINGYGKLHVDLCEYSIGNNNVFCLKPNQVHQFEINEQIEGFVISFTNSFFNLAEHEFDLTSQAILSRLFHEWQVIRVHSEMEVDMNEIVMKMVKEFENQFSYRTELIKRYFKIFLIYLTRRLDETFQQTEQSREADLVINFMESLDKNFKEKKMVAEYASQFSVTPNYLNRIIKKLTGYSAGHHIRQRVVLEAKRLGRFSDAGMKEIAYTLGFTDSAHFSKFFKTVAGNNFSVFKKEGYTGLLPSPIKA